MTRIFRSLSIVTCFYLCFSPVIAEEVNTNVTEWVSSSELNKIRIELNDSRLLPTYVDGRVHDGRIEYKATFGPFPLNMNYYYAQWGLTDDWYKKYNDDYLKDNYQQLYHSTFTDHSGSTIHQSTWVLIDELPKPFWMKIIEYFE